MIITVALARAVVEARKVPIRTAAFVAPRAVKPATVAKEAPAPKAKAPVVEAKAVPAVEVKAPVVEAEPTPVARAQLKVVKASGLMATFFVRVWVSPSRLLNIIEEI